MSQGIIKKIKTEYVHTIYASYLGYITQAIVNNFVPLLFLTFQSQYGITLEKLGLLVTINFGVQLFVDFIAAKFIDKIGYRTAIVAAHIFSGLGLIGLAVFPELLPPYMGIVLAIICYAIGGGIIEVLVSPIVEACPTTKKEAAMSLLHSFIAGGMYLLFWQAHCFSLWRELKTGSGWQLSGRCFRLQMQCTMGLYHWQPRLRAVRECPLVSCLKVKPSGYCFC